MKLIVETTGDFQIYGSPANFARHDRPSVVHSGGLMEQRIGVGQLRILGQVSDDATDEALVEALEGAKGDTDLAVQSFISEFPLEAPAAKEDKKAETKK